MIFGRRRTIPSEIKLEVPSIDDSHALMKKIAGELASCSPLMQVAKLAGFRQPSEDASYPKHITIDNIDQPTLCSRGRGTPDDVGVSFTFKGQRGEQGIVYFFADGVAMWPTGERGPRLKFEAEDIHSYVGNYTEELKAVIDKMTPPSDPRHEEQLRSIRKQLTQFLG